MKKNSQNRNELYRVLYEDESIVCVYKAPGCLSQEDVTGDPDLVNLLKTHYQTETRPFIGLVHRLDRPACGIMVFARTPNAARHLGQQIQEQQFIKTYLAVVHGKPALEAVLKDTLIISRTGQKTVVSEEKNNTNSVDAELQYSLKATHMQRSLLEIQLITGRKHQIRSQLADRGFPIVGDRKYGSKEVLRDPGMIALCAWKLECVHPETGKALTFHSPRPHHWPWHDPDLFKKVRQISKDLRPHQIQKVQAGISAPPKIRQKRQRSKRYRG